MTRVLLFFITTLGALIGAAQAHTSGTTGFAAITVQGQTVRYVLTLNTEALQAPSIVPNGDFDSLAGMVARQVAVVANGKACTAVPGSVQPPSPTRPTAVVT